MLKNDEDRDSNICSQHRDEISISLNSFFWKAQLHTDAKNNLYENQFFRLIIVNKKGMVLTSDKGIDEIDLMDISSLWIIPTDIKARYQDDF